MITYGYFNPYLGDKAVSRMPMPESGSLAARGFGS